MYDKINPNQKSNEGVKYDGDKLRYDLLPVLAMEELVKVFTHGSKKYGDRNWEKGMSYGRVYAAGMRHATKFWKGEEIDEMGTHTLANCVWNFLCLLEYELQKEKYKSFDDRPEIYKKKQVNKYAEKIYNYFIDNFSPKIIKKLSTFRKRK